MKNCPKCKSDNLNISEFGTFCNNCDWELVRTNVDASGEEQGVL